VRKGAVPDSLLSKTPFFVFESEPVYSCIEAMFKYSSNFAAEMLFKTIAAETDSLKSNGSWLKGADVVTKWWIKKGLPGTITVANGSGMGNINRISAYQTVALLDTVWSHKEVMPEFVSALSVSGCDGTIERRFTDSWLKGIVRAKTGTLNDYGVGNLAGYLLLKNKTYAFAIFINNAGADQMRHWQLQQKLLETVFPESLVKGRVGQAR
jgi:D-alanyl-D-alanine carboxypeptidase/D-alanyl-D-alanine-endopeptidase (penicillin-binding protein 4)